VQGPLKFEACVGAPFGEMSKRGKEGAEVKGGEEDEGVGPATASASPTEHDEIVVLDAGRVAERGRHADLLRAGGLYAEMWNRQAAEREMAEAVDA
jgi:hypothetical protein